MAPLAGSAFAVEDRKREHDRDPDHRGARQPGHDYSMLDLDGWRVHIEWKRCV